MDFFVKAPWRPVMSRSSGDVVGDSSDAVSPLDDVEYVVMDSPNVND